ncbi:predicted dehydrogenase [Bellilinea caldifistulae]|uniref:Dehydrogenase n=1 Tax=Bellilinea caldifistulae TaxID=360411 RepID=A0A0P6X280_9CHLR|nr:Gfo/Idh/MocA family oxidoreductase [Bellilinea caldifistulae]KPL73640.1 dehydrogenase [Bellilinea caldifistulae]GAP10278.1 predicted dehydrogenase [Bellilinea caldifistulae]
MTKLSKSTIGVGVAGTGFIGPAHVEALRRNGITVLGLAENTREKAEQKAAEMGIPRIYGSLDEMLKDDDIQVVHLATPNYLHYPHAKAALLAGKHVVCEKPLAMNTRESAELVQLAKETGKVNVVNFNIRMYPLVQQARSMVQSGELGDLFILQGSYLQDWLLFPTDWNWRLEPELGGSLRAVGDIGSHWLDLITFITGLRVVEVFADFKTMHPVRKKPARPVETYTGKILQPEDYVDQPIFTEDYATVLLHFENDVRGVLTVGQVCSGRKNRLFFEINASKSSLAWDSERPNELWVGHRTQPNQIIMKDPALLSPEARAVTSYPGGHNEGFPDTFKQLYNKVYNYILAGDYNKPPDFPTFADGHYEMQLCEAIERSAKEKVWIKV